MEATSAITEKPPLCRVAIVGAGFSGTMSALQLLRSGRRQVFLIERGETFAAGVAYGTSEDCHLLNVRAGNMSAFPDDPDHFLTWLSARGLDAADGFARRRLYHAYLRELLGQEEGNGRLRLIRDQAVSIARLAEGLRVDLADGESIECDYAVLASGNLPPAPILHAAGLGDGRYIQDPWSSDGMAAIRRLAVTTGDVLLVGTGLTMVDMCLSLRSRGLAGRITALSRRGLVPRRHGDLTPVALPQLPKLPLSLLLRTMRQRAAEHGWREAVDAVRPYSKALWSGLSGDDKRRFLRHLRPYWDVHRHRIAPAVAETLDGMREEKRLEVIAGRIRHVQSVAGGLEVTFAPRGGAAEVTRRFKALINCTGPLGNIRKSGDPLLHHLLANGLAAADALDVGLAVDDQCRIVGPDGIPDSRLFAVGPLTKGCFGEIVAVPDIRVQVQRVAQTIEGDI